MNRTKPPKCKCGCGGLVNKSSHDNSWNAFINGHGRKGVACTKEHKRKLSESKIKYYNKPVLKSILCKCGCGEITQPGNNYIHGHNRRHKLFSKEHRRKLSANKKGQLLSLNSRNKISETLKKFYKIKENHPRWSGGKSTEEYGTEFNDKLKTKVRKIYNCTCQVCGKEESKEGKPLAVHHIDYNKKNNSLDNLIPLCMSCHSRTNSYRIYWEGYFKERKKWSEQNENQPNVQILS